MHSLISKDTKAVLFDYDDTLVNTIENVWKLHKHVAMKYYSKKLLDKEIKEHWGKPLRTLVGLLYSTEDLSDAMEKLYLEYPNFPKILFDSTIGVLEGLRQDGKLVGIVTAHDRDGLTTDLRDLGIPLELFDYIQTSDDTSVHKPNPLVFEPALEWLAGHDVTNERALYVGDSLKDMEAATGANMQFIGVTTGLITSQQFKKAGARTIGSLEELLQ